MADEVSTYFYFRTTLRINYLYLKNIYVKQSAVLATQAGIEKIGRQMSERKTVF
jgi:hypothetical protein